MALEIRNTPSEIRVARVSVKLHNGIDSDEFIHIYVDQDGIRNTTCLSFDDVDELIGILLEAKKQSFPDRSKIN